LALDRLSRREDGKLEYRLKKPLPGGATTLLMTPAQLLKRLVALVVKPKVHLTRFFGVFAPNSPRAPRWCHGRPSPFRLLPPSCPRTTPRGDAGTNLELSSHRAHVSR
jgi:hypothetical protein